MAMSKLCESEVDNVGDEDEDEDVMFGEMQMSVPSSGNFEHSRFSGHINYKN
jgi:hypothetical protein